MKRILTVQFLLIMAVTGCDGGSSPSESGTSLDPNVPPVLGDSWIKPTPFSTWQWQLQLQGNINTTYSVQLYDVDLFTISTSSIQALQAIGIKVICYFSAGSYEDFREDSNKFLPSDLGSTLDGFADERWLDIRSSNVHTIMKDRLDTAKQKGCDGVEPDNMDGYLNNSGFALTANDQLAFNRFIANESHNRELSVGLKNDLDQIADLVDYFDFSVNEQCFEFQECNLLTPFIDNGKAVLNAEYADKFVTDETERDAMCSESINMQFSTLVLPLDLDDSFRFSCL